MKILTGQGIGDAVWTLVKAQGIADQYGDGQVVVCPAIYDRVPAELRAIEFLSRFRGCATQSVIVPRIGGCAGPALQPGDPADAQGRYRYWPDGPCTIPGVSADFVAFPNGALERGVRLEQWLPDVATDWAVFQRYQETESERLFAEALRRDLGPYVVLFMGSAGSNTSAGHNRGPLWTPDQWVQLGTALQQRGMAVVVVGADYDQAYYTHYVEPNVSGWHNYVGQWPSVCRTFAVTRRAQAVISYQSGIGICSHYFGVPVAIFWRPEGDSIAPDYYLTFDERMAHAWAYPDWEASGKLLPCIYGRHTVEDILRWVEPWLVS